MTSPEVLVGQVRDGLQRLEDQARAAAPDGDDSHLDFDVLTGWDRHHYDDATAAHISAFRPSAVLELVTVLRTLVEDLAGDLTDAPVAQLTETERQLNYSARRRLEGLSRLQLFTGEATTP